MENVNILRFQVTKDKQRLMLSLITNLSTLNEITNIFIYMFVYKILYHFDPP